VVFRCFWTLSGFRVTLLWEEYDDGKLSPQSYTSIDKCSMRIDYFIFWFFDHFCVGPLHWEMMILFASPECIFWCIMWYCETWFARQSDPYSIALLSFRNAESDDEKLSPQSYTSFALWGVTNYHSDSFEWVFWLWSTVHYGMHICHCRGLELPPNIDSSKSVLDQTGAWTSIAVAC